LTVVVVRVAETVEVVVVNAVWNACAVVVEVTVVGTVVVLRYRVSVKVVVNVPGLVATVVEVNDWVVV